MKLIRIADGLVMDPMTVQSGEFERYYGHLSIGELDPEYTTKKYQQKLMMNERWARRERALHILAKAINDCATLGFKIEPETNDDCVPYTDYPLTVVDLK